MYLSVMVAAWSCCGSGEDVCLWWQSQWPLPWRHSGRLDALLVLQKIVPLGVVLLALAFTVRNSCGQRELRCYRVITSMVFILLTMALLGSPQWFQSYLQ